MFLLYIKNFFVPPSLILIFLFLSLITWRSRKQSFIFLFLGSVLLLGMSIPAVSQKYLVEPLQRIPALTSISYEPHTAIVIIGGGRSYNAPEFQNKDDAKDELLSRLRYGAYLAKQSHLPVLLSGGESTGKFSSEALVMKQVLQRDFGVNAKWIEEKSLTTYENANYSYPILKKNHIQKIYLVTQAMHMRRALGAFKRTGIEVIPAPIDFREWPVDPILYWIPTSRTLMISSYAVYEYEGLLFYWVRAQYERLKI